MTDQFVRKDKRLIDQLRPIEIIATPQRDPLGSVLIKWGHTHVVCSVQIDDKVPHWMQGQSTGWITAEYGMLPGSSDKRIQRDKIRSTGRTHEIQRLIGRSIRSCMDLADLGPRTVQIDCDVLQADGGTRVASITGSYLALRLALKQLKARNRISKIPRTVFVSAVSVGKMKDRCLLDLSYEEDLDAMVDANFVMNAREEWIEVQSTGEESSFSRTDLNSMLDLATKGCHDLFRIQADFLRSQDIEP